MKMLERLIYALFMITLTGACEIGDQVDPNSPSLEAIVDNANIAQLNNLVFGTLSQLRDEHQIYFDNMGIVGREHYRFSGSDPRFVSDLLGQGGGALDNNAFYTTRNYLARYRNIKNANILIEAVNNTQADITQEEKNGYIGFAQTLIAHELLMNVNVQYENGIRVDVTDPDNLGPFVSKDEALTFIADLLDEAADHLSAAGDEFLVTLPSGFAGFDTPASFRQFNRALAARVAVYREMFAEALAFLNESFFDLNGDFKTGVYHTFSTGSGDVLNQLFIGRNATGDIRAAREEWIDDAEPGDNRLSKVALRDVNNPDVGPATQAGLSSDYDVYFYKSNTDPIPIIRNEELILIYAEALIQEGNLIDAVAALDAIRNGAGLPDYSGPVDQASLIDEMLHQRRYALWFEGHRWVDMRRYDRLDELPLDRPGDIVHIQFPRPQSEQDQQGG